MTIDAVLQNDLCLGCGLCQSVFDTSKVKVELNTQGFFRPVQLEVLSETQQDQFNQLCPGISIKNNQPVLSENYDDPIWGQYNQLLTGYALDTISREKGSSGGVLTSLATYLIESGEVEAILHVGQGSEMVIRTEYKVSRTSQAVIENAGSRYAPSATLVNLDEILEEYNSVAIIAKPCEIAALRKYKEIFEEKGKRIKYLLSFFCAGVPSMKGTEASIKQLGFKPESVQSLRYRGEGWPGYFKVTDNVGNEGKMSYNDSWGTILNRHLQFRCKICPDGIGEQADIVCADAWEEAEGGYPSFEQRPGQSMIMTRTNLGNNLLRNAIAQNYLAINDPEFKVQTLRVIQPYQFLRKANIIPRVLAMKLFGKKVPSYEWKTLLRASNEVGIIEKTKNFLGTVKRMI